MWVNLGYGSIMYSFQLNCDKMNKFFHFSQQHLKLFPNAIMKIIIFFTLFEES